MKTKRRDERIENLAARYKNAESLKYFLTNHYTHTRDSMQDRYGIAITYDEWEALNQRIYDEWQCTFLFKPNERTAVYKLIYLEKEIGVMFSTQMSCVTTVMPADDCRLNLEKP